MVLQIVKRAVFEIDSARLTWSVLWQMNLSASAAAERTTR
jgi:hypothetical protein